MHTVSVSGKYDANSSVGPISQHLVLFILLTFYLNYLPLWSVSDDQKLERKKTEQNKAKQTFLFKTRFELRDHPFTTGRIATEVIVISVSVFFFTFCLGRTFCVQPRHPRWRSFHFPHWKNSSGKFHRFHFFRFNVYVKPVVLQSSGTEICFRLSFTDAPKNKISRSGMFEKEIWCWWVFNNAWLAMQTGCFKLGKHFKLPSFMQYVYLFIYSCVFPSIFSFTCMQPHLMKFHCERNLASFFVVLSSSLSLIAFLGNRSMIRLYHG